MSALAEFAPAERTFSVMLERQARRFRDRPLFQSGDALWTYDATRELAARMAGTLAAGGVRAGDRVALISANRPEAMLVLLGCAWLGAVAVPINVASRGPQLQHVLANSGARLLVIEAGLVGVLEVLDPTTLALERLWTIGAPPAPMAGPWPCAALPRPGAPHPAGALGPGDTLAILYTSGTTGPSKGVCCPHAQYYWWGVHTATLLELRDGDRLCTTLPIFHTNALNTFYQALLTGSALILEPRFSASGFWRTLALRDATATYVLGAMVPMLLAREPSPEERQHRIRSMLAPGVPGVLHEPFLARTGIRLLDGYGSTETNFVIGAVAAEQRPGCMGKVRPGFEARVVDADDNELPDGEPGELVLRAAEPFAFATGYFAMAEKTVEAWRNLWFHSGDRVVREADGSFRFVDRLKDAIRRRGENISSFEVEQVLQAHPEVDQAAVFPVRSELAEDEVAAAVVLKPGSRLAPAALLDWCRPRLAYFAVPRFVDFVEALPTTESGKVQKFKLRERGVTAAMWDREAAGYTLRRD